MLALGRAKVFFTYEELGSLLYEDLGLDAEPYMEEFLDRLSRSGIELRDETAGLGIDEDDGAAPL